MLHGPMQKWGIKVNFPPLAAHPTVSSDLLPRIGTGSVVVKPNIKELITNTKVLHFFITSCMVGFVKR